MQMQQALSQPQSTPVDESQSSPIKVSRKKKGKPKLAQKKQHVLMNKKRVIVSSGPQHDSSSKVHGHQAPKRQKSNSTREYTRSTNTPEFGISLDDDDDDIQAEQEPPSRPMGRDKTKAKGKAMSSYDYEAKKLSLVEELAETNRVKKQAIEQFDQKIGKFYELE
ncbi:hypothetical protein L1987_62730 [Smallanthus sonchifolius]|uniref:Uncharacterized protein n=1 Tax=Smallanthus sonchifolius TaxID=185202 RepID=A0ACB9CBA4_9ASTR|nr:hypothetical protein L1987_62730 [Smallanthus sonchifolius]